MKSKNSIYQIAESRNSSDISLLFSVKKGLIAVMLLVIAGVRVSAQHSDKPLRLTATELKKGAYWVQGGVCNTGFIVGKDGVIVIDTQLNKPAADKAIEEVRNVTSLPIKTVILTHADPDHIGGLPAYGNVDNLIANENTFLIVEASVKDEEGGPFFGPLYQALAGYKPSEEIGFSKAENFNNVKVELINVAPAHTSADLAIYLPGYKIVYAGDMLVNNCEFPVIHYGGSSLNWIKSMEGLLALKANYYVPGHGPMLSKEMLQQRLDATVKRREAVKQMVLAGKSLEEVKSALPDKPVDPRFPTFTETVYHELTEGYPTALSPWATLHLH